MDLAGLADFHAVARHGSFGEASRRGGVPKATISRRIRALECCLGVRLFERGGRTLRLTDEGENLRARTAAPLDELIEAENEIAGQTQRPRGRVRISVPSQFAQEHFGRFAAAFAQRYPDVQLDVHVQDRFVDVAVDEFDVVVRVNPDPDSRLVGRRLFEQPFLVVAAPSVPRLAADEATVKAVTLLSWPADDIWKVRSGHRHLAIRPTSGLRFSSLVPLRDAILAGAGAGVLPLSAVREDVRAGRLVEWGQLVDRRAEIWALTSDARLRSAKVSVLVEMLVDRFRDTPSRPDDEVEAPASSFPGMAQDNMESMDGRP